jgi:hypothetical protein
MRERVCEGEREEREREEREKDEREKDERKRELCVCVCVYRTPMAPSPLPLTYLVVLAAAVCGHILYEGCRDEEGEHFSAAPECC